MTTLNKTQTIDLAKKLARENTTVQAQTIEQINEMSWQDRTNTAADLARISRAMASTDVNLKYGEVFVSAFVDATQSIWGGKVRDLDKKRQSWRSAITGISASQAEAQVKALIESLHIRGARDYGGGVEVERSFAIGGNLYVRFDRDYDTKVVNPDNANQRAGVYRVRVELNWSSTGRTIAEATAAVKLYQELIDAAAEVEVVMNREHIIWTYGVDDGKAETEQ